jgi:galacturan 1,4-alpha-galacturonidase
MMLQYIRSLLLTSVYSSLIFSEFVHSSAVPVRSALETVQKRATCTPKSAGDPAVDDVPAIQAAIQECGNGGIIVLPAGVTFAMNSQLLLKGCVNCQIQIEGTLKASDDVALWNEINPMINIEGITGATITSLTGKGVIDGNGQKSYDAFGQGQDIYRPVVMSVNGCKDVSITNFAIVQAPVAFINVGAQSTNIKFSNLDLSARSSSQYNPRNTDGFDIGSSSYISLDKIRIENQDDCVAFKPAADHVTVTNIECIGSHGLSIGSLGKYPGNNDTVTNVLVKGATVRGADKAAGIKIYPGGSEFGTAWVKNVTWEDVKVDNCDYAFQAEACYNPGG